MEAVVSASPGRATASTSSVRASGESASPASALMLCSCRSSTSGTLKSGASAAILARWVSEIRAPRAAMASESPIVARQSTASLSASDDSSLSSSCSASPFSMVLPMSRM